MSFSRRGLLGLGFGAAALSTTRFAAAKAGARVRIVNSAGELNLILQRLIATQGFLKEFSVDAAFANISDGSKIMAGLLSGEQDICMFAGIGQIFPAIERGARIKIVAGATMSPDQAIFSANPSIRSIGDLKGRTIGVGAIGSLLHEIMVALLRKHGVRTRDVTFVNIGSSADVLRAVAARKVDAGPSQLNAYFHQKRFGVHVLEGGKVWRELPQATFQGAFATDEAIATKRDALVRTLAAYGALYRYVCLGKSRAAYLAAAAAVSGRDEAEEVGDEWSFFQTHKTLATDLTLTPLRIRFLQDLNVRLGIQKSELPFAEVADMSLAAEALRLLAKA